MQFNSASYIFVFLPVAAAGYFLFSEFRLTFLARVWLLLLSLAFCAFSDLSLLLVLVCSAVLNYFTGCLLARAYPPFNTEGTKPVPSKPVNTKILLALGVLFNIGLLAYFKYTNFFVQEMNNILHSDIHVFEIILPLGISYYTFQQVAYLVDCSRNKTHESNFVDYCLFVTFFPRLIAGPIVRYNEMMPQFKRIRNYVPDWRNIAMGLCIFFMGLFKKVVIADSFAVWANLGFDSDKALTFVEAWGSSLSYTFQLYYDFSGYSDMAIGAALLFNIRLPINFNSPYKAADIQDFWRRWHITLSRWLRDYLYIPLGGSRSGNLRTYGNIMVTFLLAGLWHGAGWTFIIWGGLHGAALVACRLWKRTGFKLDAFTGWFTTFLFVNFAWVFFRAPTFSDSFWVLKGMVGLNGYEFSQKFAETVNALLAFWPQAKLAGGADTSLLLPLEALGFIAMFGLVAFLLPNSLEVSRYIENKTLSFPAPLRPFLRNNFHLPWAIATAVMVIFGLYRMLSVRVTEFIYFNF